MLQSDEFWSLSLKSLDFHPSDTLLCLLYTLPLACFYLTVANG